MAKSDIVLPFLRTPYNYDRDAVSDQTGLSCGEPSRTQQNFKDECDINVIMERFGKTGQVSGNLRVPSYDDFTGVSDFQSAMNAVREASENFMELPAKVRARFDNDPQLFLEFVASEDNRQEAVDLGLIKPAPAAPEPALVRVVQDANPAGAPSST